jgi:hypothetical protein
MRGLPVVLTLVATCLWAAELRNPNLVPNPGFEAAAPKADDLSSPAKAWCARLSGRKRGAAPDAENRVVRDPGAGREGRAGLRLTATGKTITEVFPGEARAGRPRPELIPVRGGERYYFGYWANVRRGILVGQMILYDKDRRPLPGKRTRLKAVTGETGGRWLKFERSAVLPETASYVSVQFGLGWGSASKQLCDIDAVEVRSGGLEQGFEPAAGAD